MEVRPELTGAHLPVETSVDGSMSIGDEFVVTYLWLPLTEEATNNPLLRGRIPICDLLAWAPQYECLFDRLYEYAYKYVFQGEYGVTIAPAYLRSFWYDKYLLVP